MAIDDVKDIIKNIKFVRDMFIAWDFNKVELDDNDEWGISYLLNKIIEDTEALLK